MRVEREAAWSDCCVLNFWRLCLKIYRREAERFRSGPLPPLSPPTLRALRASASCARALYPRAASLVSARCRCGKVCTTSTTPSQFSYSSDFGCTRSTVMVERVRLIKQAQPSCYTVKYTTNILLEHVLGHHAKNTSVVGHCLVELSIVRVDDLSHFPHLLLRRLVVVRFVSFVVVQHDLLVRTQVQPRCA